MVSFSRLFLFEKLVKISGNEGVLRRMTSGVYKIVLKNQDNSFLSQYVKYEFICNLLG